MSTIAITGVGGLVGRRLVAELDRRDDVTRIVGLDRVAPTRLTSPKLAFRQTDIRDPDLGTHLRGVDALVHLAFQVDPMHDEPTMREVNVEGTRNVLTSAVAAGVTQQVYLSSVTAYGAHPDNDVPLTEDSPVRGTPRFNYTLHKAEIEAWLWPWAAQQDDLDLAVLRPAVILGPGVENFITRTLEAPRLTLVRGHKPPLQFVHLDDVVSAIVHALDQRLTGPFNVSAEGWLSMDEVTAIVGRRTVAVPEEVAIGLTERLWRIGVGEQPPGMVQHLMHPWVASPAKLVATGWRPRHTNRDALDEFAREHRPYVAVAGLRARKRTLRSASLAAAGVAGLVAAQNVRRARQARARRAG